MLKKGFVFALALALLLFAAACGSGEAEKGNSPAPPIEKPAAEAKAGPGESPAAAPEEEDGVSIAGEDVRQGDKGSGPLILESRFGVLTIPADIDYELYYLPEYDTTTATLHIRFGAGNTGAAAFRIATTTMIESQADAVQECIRMNDYGTKTAALGEEVSYGGLAYQSLTLTTPDGKDIDYFLVSHYLTEDGRHAYVEMQANGQDHGFYNMDIDDPAILAMLESLIVR